MELLTIKEAAAFLRVSPITVRRRIAGGQLRAVRVGKGIRIPREALDEFLRPAASPASLDVRVAEPVAVYEPGAKKLSLSDRLALERRLRLTPEEQEKRLQAIERARQERAEDMKRRGGRPWIPSWELLDESREQRTRDLMQ